jgi:hypothetical protein
MCPCTVCMYLICIHTRTLSIYLPPSTSLPMHPPFNIYVTLPPLEIPPTHTGTYAHLSHIRTYAPLHLACGVSATPNTPSQSPASALPRSVRSLHPDGSALICRKGASVRGGRCAMGGDWVEGGKEPGSGTGACCYVCTSMEVVVLEGTYDEGAGVRVDLREGRVWTLMGRKCRGT